MPPNASAALVQSHEERILRLEEQIPAFANQLGSVSAQVEAVAGDVAAGRDEMMAKLAELGEQIEAHSKASQASNSTVIARLDTLEGKAKTKAVESRVHASLLKKATLPLVAVGAAVLAKVGDWLWTILGG